MSCPRVLISGMIVEWEGKRKVRQAEHLYFTSYAPVKMQLNAGKFGQKPEGAPRGNTHARHGAFGTDLVDFKGRDLRRYGIQSNTIRVQPVSGSNGDLGPSLLRLAICNWLYCLLPKMETATGIGLEMLFLPEKKVAGSRGRLYVDRVQRKCFVLLAQTKCLEGLIT